MRRPVIGIPSKIRQKDDHDLWHREEIVSELRYLIAKHGGIAIMLTPSELRFDFNENDLGDDRILSQEEKEYLHEEADLCDGILLQGGDFSNAYEVEIAKYALKKDIPLLGICAGFNNILRALGSNTREDVERSHSIYDRDYRHRIRIVKDTLLYEIIGKEEYDVNSLHTMVADEKAVEGYAKICAYSEDGLVESFTVEGKRFVLALKWHPEIMREEGYVDVLFERFIGEAMNR